MDRGDDGQGQQPQRAAGGGVRALTFSLVLAAAGTAACGTLSSVPPAGGSGPSHRSAPSGVSGPSGGTGSGDTLAATSVPGGSATPKEAAGGWWNALAGNDLIRACLYVVPSQRDDCNSQFEVGGASVAHAGVGNEFVDGAQALVAVLTTGACFALGTGTTTTMCITNTNPDRGLPTSDAGFAAAQRDAFAIESALIPCEELGGSWYVELVAAGTGPTGVSGPSGAAGASTSGS